MTKASLRRDLAHTQLSAVRALDNQRQQHNAVLDGLISGLDQIMLESRGRTKEDRAASARLNRRAHRALRNRGKYGSDDGGRPESDSSGSPPLSVTSRASSSSLGSHMPSPRAQTPTPTGSVRSTAASQRSSHPGSQRSSHPGSQHGSVRSTASSKKPPIVPEPPAPEPEKKKKEVGGCLSCCTVM